MSRRGQHICAGSFRRRPDAGGQRTPRSMSRRAPHVLTQGFGGRRPYAEQQRTATRMCRHLCAGSCRSLTLCCSTADGHDAWAAVPCTHIAPGRLVAGHKGGPSKVYGQKCGPPRPVRTRAGSWRSPAICRATADGHEVWAATPRTHIARGLLVAGHEDGPSESQRPEEWATTPRTCARGIFVTGHMPGDSGRPEVLGVLEVASHMPSDSWRQQECDADPPTYARGLVGL